MLVRFGYIRFNTLYVSSVPCRWIEFSSAQSDEARKRYVKLKVDYVQFDSVNFSSVMICHVIFCFVRLCYVPSKSVTWREVRVSSVFIRISFFPCNSIHSSTDQWSYVLFSSAQVRWSAMQVSYGQVKFSSAEISSKFHSKISFKSFTKEL